MQKTNTKTTYPEYILIFGVLLSPMTSLRIWKIGPGEVLCLIYTFINIKKILRSKKLNHFLFRFWGIWLLLIIAGSFLGAVVSPNEIDISQLTTYLYLGVICIGIYHGLEDQKDVILLKIIYKIVIYSTIIYGLLYLYGRFVADSIFGIPIWFGGVRYSPFGENPHQFAGYSGSLVYLILFLQYIKFKPVETFLSLLIILYLSLQTFSSTLIAAYAVSLLFLPIFIFRGSRYFRLYLFLLLLLYVAIVFAIFDSLYNAIYYWIISDPNGLGRFQIWSSLDNIFRKSPIIGLGPGNHASRFTHGSTIDRGTMEYHNAYLELFALSGILGLGNFIIFYIRVIKECLNQNPPLFLMLLFLGGYAFGGFIFRRLPFWVFIIFVIVIVEKFQNQGGVQR